MKSSARVLAISATATAAVAALGGAVTSTSVNGWYRTLDKPEFTPPDAVFAPVWSVLYAMQAVAAWLAWRAEPSRARPVATLYGAQLTLNLGWTLLFFGLRRPGAGVIEIAVLWVAIAATLDAFRRRSRAAALLLIPYLGWTTFAVALTFAIWRRNRGR